MPIRQEVIIETEEGPIVQEEEVILDVNPATVEIAMYQLSERKDEMAQLMLKTIDTVSIENIIDAESDSDILDMSTYDLMYGHASQQGIKARILNTIPSKWAYPLDPSNMGMMMATADLVSSHAYALTKYGLPRPVNSFANVVSAYNASTHGSQSFSLIYDRNFFLVDDNRGYTVSQMRNAITVLSNAPTNEYDFFTFISRPHFDDIKTIILEMALAIPVGVLNQQEVVSFNRYRQHILTLYANFWNTYGGGRLVHILWYGIKKNSHLAKKGLSSTPELNTRILVYDINNYSSDARWRYLDSKEREAIYLSGMAHSISEQQ